MGEDRYNFDASACVRLHERQTAGGVGGLKTVGARGVCVFAVLLVFVLSGTSAFARFSCRVGLYNTTQWTDNIYSSSTDPIGDTYNLVAPSVSVEHLGKRLSFYATLSVSHQKYRKLDDLNRNSINASLFFSYALSPRTQITFENTFGYAHDVTTQTARFEDVRTEAGVISQLLIRDVKADQYTNNAGLTLKHQPNRRTGLTFKLSRDTTEFTEDEFDDSGTTTLEADVRREISRRESISCFLSFSRYLVNEDEVDTRRFQLRVTYRRRISAKTTFRLATSFRKTNDMRNLSDLQFLTSTYELNVGVSHRITRYWALNANTGYAVAVQSGDMGPETKERAGETQFDISLERVSPISTMYFRVWQTMNSSAASGYDSKSMTFSYSRNFADKLWWDCMLSYANNVSSAGDEIDTWVFSTGLFWYISENADMSLRFTRSKQTVNDEAGSEMKKDAVELSINLRYKIKR